MRNYRLKNNNTSEEQRGYTPAGISSEMMQSAVSAGNAAAVYDAAAQDRTLSCVRSSLTVYEYHTMIIEVDV